MRISTRVVLSVTFLIGFSFQSKDLHAGLVFAVKEDTAAYAVIQKANQQVQQRQYRDAKATLMALASEPNQAHPDLVLADLQLDNKQFQAAKQTLERFSAFSGPRFDLFLVYGKLALAEQRWFDAFVHSQMARNQEMPKTWTKEFRRSMQDEVDVVALTSITARGAWEHASKVASERRLDEKSDLRILEFAAKAAFKQQKANDAYRILTILETKFPEGPRAITRLALLFQADNNGDQAEKYYLQAASGDSADPHAYLEYARWLFSQERHSEVSPLLGKLARLEGIDGSIKTEGKYLLAVVDRRNGKLRAARKKLEQLHEAAPEALPIANQLALVLIESNETKDQQKALEIATENKNRASGNPEIWATLGWVQFNVGQFDDAEKSLAIASSTGNVSRDTAFYIAQLKKHLGQTDEASQLLKKAKESKGPFFYADRIGQ